MYFSDFSTNFYGISKFTAKITKESLEHYSTESMAIQITPWGFVSYQLEVPGPGQRGEAGFDRPFPGEGFTGGEGNKAWELQGSK